MLALQGSEDRKAVCNWTTNYIMPRQRRFNQTATEQARQLILSSNWSFFFRTWRFIEFTMRTLSIQVLLGSILLNHPRTGKNTRNSYRMSRAPLILPEHSHRRWAKNDSTYPFLCIADLRSVEVWARENWRSTRRIQWIQQKYDDGWTSYDQTLQARVRWITLLDSKFESSSYFLVFDFVSWPLLLRRRMYSFYPLNILCSKCTLVSFNIGNQSNLISEVFYLDAVTLHLEEHDIKLTVQQVKRESQGKRKKTFIQLVPSAS